VLKELSELAAVAAFAEDAGGLIDDAGKGKGLQAFESEVASVPRFFHWQTALVLSCGSGIDAFCLSLLELKQRLRATFFCPCCCD
jgi:hypothetical protein